MSAQRAARCHRAARNDRAEQARRSVASSAAYTYSRKSLEFAPLFLSELIP